MRRAGLRFLLAACLLAVLLIPSAQATPGALDPTFGTGGKVTTPIGPSFDDAYALTLQPDGKLVAAGSSSNGSTYVFALARYNPDGSLDTSFNGTGKVTTAIGADARAYALALQPDGKLVVAGNSWNGSQSVFALARYNPDGSLDTSFNGTGKVTTAIGSAEDWALALALQPDGKLLAAGTSFKRPPAGQSLFALARYNPDGSLDQRFGVGGKVTTEIGPYEDEAHALALQPDGKLVAAGFRADGFSRRHFALVRYKPDGSLDTSFNGTGKVTTKIGSFDEALALALQPDGKLVAAGSNLDVGRDGSDFALARYKPNGSLDTSFNGSGKVTTFLGSGSGAFALALQPNGKLVAAGSSHDGDRSVFALARYKPDGALDQGFGVGGHVTTAIGPHDAEAYALALQPDGKLVAAGRTSDEDFALARYLGQDACVVPKVKGKMLNAAKRAIRRADCSVGKVTRAFSAKVKKGRVISQKPRPGKKRAAGFKVKLAVSNGKKA